MTNPLRFLALGSLWLLLPACSSCGPGPAPVADAGVDAGEPVDSGELVDAGEVPDSGAAPTRLRIINGSTGDLWIFYQIGSGGGALSSPVAHQVMLAAGAHIDYPIPDIGLAATRFWPGFNCDATGNNCQVGQSGGPPADGFTCPAYNCAPPVDTKWEGTFGCLPSVPVADCQINPSSPTMAVLPQTDSWDTSLVDGFTMPFRVEVVGTCPGGPTAGTIDCSTLATSLCPTAEDLSTGNMYPALASENMLVVNPMDGTTGGCYADCSRLTMTQWQSTGTYMPGDPEAQMYCCPTPPISPDMCRAGPVASTAYTDLVHTHCPQTYAYSYDDGSGLFNCPAGVHYEVTFYAPM